MDDFEARLNATAAVDELDDRARRLGLYLGGWDVAPVPTGDPDVQTVGVVAQFDIGEVAFSDRVQHPERFYTDETFRVIEADTAVDEFLETRQRIAERLAAGEDPLEI